MPPRYRRAALFTRDNTTRRVIFARRHISLLTLLHDFLLLFHARLMIFHAFRRLAFVIIRFDDATFSLIINIFDDADARLFDIDALRYAIDTTHVYFV